MQPVKRPVRVVRALAELEDREIEDKMSQRNAESGFSLIELVIALVVTLVITGAMWGLLAGGQSAFRREPELMDRQQAIRLGMDRVVADVALAGQRMRLDTQAFAPGLNAAGMAGPRGLAGSPGATDELEIRTTYDCPELIVERTNGVEIDIAGTLPSCYRPETPILLIYPDGSSQIGWVDKVTGAGGGGGQNSVSIPPAQAPPLPADRYPEARGYRYPDGADSRDWRPDRSLRDCA